MLLCFALLSIGFSTIASAETVEVKPYQILQHNYLSRESVSTADFGTTFLFQPNNDFEEKHEDTKIFTSPNYTLKVSKYAYHNTNFLLVNVDESPILEANKTYNVSLNNIYHSMLFEYNGYQYYVRNPKVDLIYVVYTDGTADEITNYTINHTSETSYCDVSFSVTTENKVRAIMINLKSYLYSSIPDEIWSLSNGNPTFTSYYGEYNGDDKYQFSLEVESQESGLLKSVIEWLKGIKSKIDDTFTNVSNGFSNVISNISNGFSDIGESFINLINNILELPSKLWNFISEGLKSLFVPSEDDMSAYKSKWDLLLSSRFGAIYEVGSLITDFADSIIESDKTNKITMPVVSLDSVGIPFSFGGQDVQIVPNGFNTIVEICKKAISIACTFLFVNGLRKRYDEVMGVEK